MTLHVDDVAHSAAMRDKLPQFRNGVGDAAIFNGRRRGRHGGKRVNPALHVFAGLFDLRHGKGIRRSRAEMRVHPSPCGGIVNRGHAYPCVDDGRDGFPLRVGALGNGRRFGSGLACRPSDSSRMALKASMYASFMPRAFLPV